MSVGKAGGSSGPKVQQKRKEEAQAPKKSEAPAKKAEGAAAKPQGVRPKGSDVAASVVKDKAAPGSDGFKAANGAKGNEVKKPSLSELSGTGRVGATATAGVQAQGPTQAANTTTLAQRAGTGGHLEGAKADKPQSFFDKINSAADRLGGAVRDGGKLLEQGGKALSGLVPGADKLREIGQQAQQAGTAIQNAPEAASQVAGQVQKGVEDLRQQGQQALEQVQQAAQPLIDKGVETVRQGLDTARQGVEAIGNAVTGFGRDIAQATDISSNVKALGEGDSYKLKVGAEGGAGIKVGAEHEIEVKKEDGKYTVSADSQLTAGIDIGLNAKIPGFEAGPEAQAKLGVGAKVEYEFKTAEDAAKAAEILAKQARANAAAGAASTAGPLGALAGQAAQAALGPTAEEKKFLQDNVSAVELKLSGNANAAVEATLGERGIAAAGAGLEGEVSTANTLRIEMENGKPSALVVKSEAEGKAAASLQAGLTGTNQAQTAEGGLSTGLGAEASIKVESETKVPLPSNFDPAALARDPGGTLKSLLRDTANGVETKTALTVDGSGAIVNSGGGAELKIETTAKPADLARSGALPALARGDIPGALRNLGDKTEVSASLTPYTKHGVSLAPEVEVAGVGVGLEFEATRQDMADNPVWEFKGTGTEAARNVNQFVKDNPELLRAATLPVVAARPELLLTQLNPMYQGVTGF